MHVRRLSLKDQLSPKKMNMTMPHPLLFNENDEAQKLNFAPNKLRMGNYLGLVYLLYYHLSLFFDPHQDGRAFLFLMKLLKKENLNNRFSEFSTGNGNHIEPKGKSSLKKNRTTKTAELSSCTIF